jgi:hypothetical protein
MTSPPGPPAGRDATSIAGLLREGTVDAELAGLAWLLIEARVPVIIGAVGESRDARVRVRDAVTDLLPAGARRIPISTGGDGLHDLTAADAPSTNLVGLDLSADPAPALQVAFKALPRGTAVAASIEADSLEDVHARLRRPDIRLSDDELTFLGLVLIVRTVGPGRVRVVAAHYARPLARDPGGHVQRLGPAVLATWDPATDGFEHFAWGVSSELAARIGIRPGDFDAEVERRSAFLISLVAGGVVEPRQVRTAIDGWRLASNPATLH